jgi:hypothetical protein
MVFRSREHEKNIFDFVSFSTKQMFERCPAERIYAQLDNVTDETTTTSAHRPPTFTVHDNINISAFQVTRKDTTISLKMAQGCRNK